MIYRRLWNHSVRGAAVVLVSVSIAFVAVTGTARAATGACSNEAVRAEQGAAALALPDCRAYELVSPSGSVPVRLAAGGQALAAVGGGRFGYYSLEPAPGSDEEGLFLLATRGPGGWSVENVTPPQGGLDNSDEIACFPSVFYSAELSTAVLLDGWQEYAVAIRNGVFESIDKVCEGDDPALVAGEPRGYSNLFLRDNEDGSYRLIDELPQGASPANAVLRDATPDLSRVVFSEEARLTPEAPAGSVLYEWGNGVDHLVSVLPDGEAVGAALVDSSQGSGPSTHAVSASGETVFFDFAGALYARLHAGSAPAAGGVCSAVEPGAACTVQVDAVQAGAAGPGGGGAFFDAAEDGSRVFFSDQNKLTADATAVAGKPDLYEYDLQTGSLQDLTVTAGIGPADVLGYSGASADGSYLYFVAENALTGEQANSQGAAAIAARPNLYLYHEGVTTFIATLKTGEGNEADSQDWTEGRKLTRVSPDGRYFVFDSVQSLTGYENQPAEPQDCDKRCHEIFLYDASTNQLSCVSCAPDGEPPTGSAEIPYPVAETLGQQPPSYLQRSVSEDGRVFFDSPTPLVAQAVNGEVNVYEYENGSVSLLSSGSGSGAAEFLDASASGEDVFFSTAQGLVQADQDNQASVYDARVDGGFPPGPGEAQQTQACETAEACKPPASEPPAQLFAASTALSGSANLTAPPTPVTPTQLPTTQTPPVKRALTRAQKLARALRACARQPKHRRAACRAAAHQRFGPKKTSSHKKSSDNTGRQGQRQSNSTRRSGR